MSAPRSIVPGQYYLITRRCTQRQFLLRPDEKTNQAFLFCLAEAAKRYGIQIVAVCAMSNHYHAVVYDPHGDIPAFLEHFHKMIAKVMNARWGRTENLWSTERTSMVECVGPDDVFDKMTYTLTNPTNDHLVDKAANWPGASSLVAQLRDKTLVIARPHWFFDPKGAMPKTVELRFIRPRGFEHLSQEQWAEKLKTAIAEAEARSAAERLASKKKVLRRRAIVAQSPFAHPHTPEPRGNTRPQVACRSPRHRIEALQRNKTFRERYADALAKLRAGVRDVLFPAGTYLLRVRNLARCEPFPAPS